MMHLLAFSDGNNDLVDIANIANEPAWAFAPEIEMLMKAGLLGFEDVLSLAKDPQTEGN
jgi:aminopeptidase-like protein